MFVKNSHNKSSDNSSNSISNKAFFQPKLIINQPNDTYEHEADAMAENVMHMPDTSLHNNSFFKPSVSSVQRKCAHCEEEEKKAQRKENNDSITEASPETENYVNTLSGGTTLNEKHKSFFESRMGYDFSNVRLHTDSIAAKSAQAVNALAYTSGNDIVFNQNQYAPDTDDGKKLLAHELTHVVQQRGDVQSKKIQRVSFNRSGCALTANYEMGLFFGNNNQTGSVWTPEREARFSQLAEQQIENAFNANAYRIIPSNRTQSITGLWDRFWSTVGRDYSCPCIGGFMPRINVSVHESGVGATFDGWHATVIANDTGTFHRSSAAESTEVFGNLDEADVQATHATGQLPVVHEFGHFIGLHHPGHGISGVTDEYGYTGSDVHGRQVAESDLMGRGTGLRPFYFNAWRNELNRTFPGCNYNITAPQPAAPAPAPVQPKLTINQPNDVHEQEADAMAENVMRIHDTSLNNNSFFKPSVSSLQRKCAHCEEEDKKAQRKENSDNAIEASPETENYVNALSGGNGLNQKEKTFFESRMGYDFSNVRLHTDGVAAKSAQAVNALAYTSGNDIVFNENQYAPGTDNGKRLLAHELTHVVQQNSGINRLSIQRDTDFDKGHELTSTALSGDPILKTVFDNQRVIRIGEHGDHVKKIQDGLLTLGIALPQFGADSSYGTETSNAVKDFQRRAGMSVREQDGIVGRKTIGLLDRSLRNGVISTDTDNAANDFTFTPEANASCTGPVTQPCDTWYTDIDALIGESANLIDKTVAEQLPPHKTPNADYESIFATLFRNGDTGPLSSTVDKVSQNYWLTRTYMTQLLTDRSFIVCGTQCDGGCASGSPAHEIRAQAINSSDDPQKKLIVFCPSFRTHPERVLIVLHESHHAAVNGSKDWAYPSERLITMLDHDKALLNAASFHLYSKAVKDPASVSLGHAVADTNNITNATERDKVNRCLAFIEHWFRLLTYDLSDTIAGTRDAKNTGRYNNRSAEQIMGEIMHPWFGLTNPPSRPVQTDVDKLTAIKQRCEWMEKDLKNAFTINLVTGASRWLPAPQSIIDVNSSATALPEPRLCMALLQELVHATPNISADTESLYVGMINEMRNARHFDPQ